MKCGLIGEKLSHSFSKPIHGMLHDYDYQLYSLRPDQLEAFINRRDWRGMNVTIPYKKTVIPYCDELSQTAREIGSVNTLIREKDGRLIGDNTDLYGLLYMAKRAGTSFCGKKVLVLGSGGTSLTAQAAARREGAKEIVVISRKGPVTYAHLKDHQDADCIINTTPVGMYPNNGEALIDLAAFPTCSGVLDVVYNPLRTALLLQAKDRGIPCGGGLPMLVAQAKKASELFTGQCIDEDRIEQIHTSLCHDRANIVVIGMPGSGKSSLGSLLAKRLGRTHVDADEVIAQKAGMPTGNVIEKQGEVAFRRLETEAICEIGKKTGIVISTGGGVVLLEQNYAPLKQNGVLIFIERELSLLPTEGRPLSNGPDALKKLYRARLPLYKKFADHCIDNNASLDETADRVLEVFNETACH